MSRSQNGNNGDGEEAIPGDGGPGGSSTDDTLQAILARLDLMNSGIAAIEARVITLEGRIDERQTVEPSVSRVTSFVPLDDPESGTKKMLDVSLKGAVEKYAEMEKEETAAAFRADFYAWEEHHFMRADKSLVRKLRDVLFEKQLPVRREAFYRVSKTLIEFRDGIHGTGTQGSTQRRTVSVAAHGGGVHTRPPDSGDGDLHGDDGHNGDTGGGGQSRRRPGESAAHTHGTSYSNLAPKPADVSKALPREAVYEGGTMENIRRKYSMFTTACRLSGLDLSNEDQIIDVMAINWLRGAARSFWEDRLQHVRTADGIVDKLEEHFLHARARRINEERWNALTYQLVRSRLLAERPAGKSLSHESTLNSLFIEIDTLADLRISAERSDQSILSKIISAVRAVDLFRPVCLQPPNTVEEIKTLLRGVAVEADNKALLERTTLGHIRSSFVAMAAVPDSDTEEYTSEVYYIDRKYLPVQSTRKVPGYGARYSVKRVDEKQEPPKHAYRPPKQPLTNQSPSPRGVELKLRDGSTLKANQCIVCMKFGCHSSRHRKATKSYLAALNDTSDTEGDGSDGEEETANNESTEHRAYATFLSASRACSFLGVNVTETKGLVGMLVDTGASHLSTVGEKWIPALRTVTGCNLDLREDAVDKIPIHALAKALVHTNGSFDCPFYFGHQSYEIRVYVVPGYSPFLLSHGDMDRIGLSYHSLEKKVVRPEDGYEQDVLWHRGAPYIPFSSVSFLSEIQLKNIHRSLGHAPSDKIVRLLQTADESLQTAEVRTTLEKIAQNCRTCALTQPEPRRFLFSSRYEGTGSFNSTIFVDVMSLTDGKALHVICAGTGYQGAAFIERETAAAIWKALCYCWLYIYSGSPDELYHDAGKNFSNAEFRGACTSLGVSVHEVPTEAHHSIGAVERAHATLRTVYNRVALDEPHLPKEERLQLSLRCVNDAPGSGGISPTMLVYGTIPKLHMPRQRDLSLEARVRTIRDSTLLARRLKAQRIRNESARRRHVPNLKHIRALEKLVPGDNVLVYREKEGWKSYPFVRLEDDSVVVQLPTTQSKFAATSCRPMHLAQVTSDGDLVPIPPPSPESSSIMELPSQLPVVEETSAEQRTTTVEQDATDDIVDKFLLDLPTNALASPAIIPEDIRRARNEELKGLIEKEAFVFVPQEESRGQRLYGYRFVDKVKPNGNVKSRFCVQAFNDRAHGLLTFAPTIQRQSLRLLLAISAPRILETRDVRQAFVQAESELRRPVYVKAPPELELPPKYVLRVIRPLYGMPEAPLHWFTTYIGHHKERLSMLQLCGDPCVLHTKLGMALRKRDEKDKHRPRGIVGIQVDDTIIIGNDEFRNLENKESKRFVTKEKVVVGRSPTLFNGLLLWRDNNEDLLVMCSTQKELEKFENNALSFDDLRSVRARCAYVAHSASPLTLYDVSRLSQVTAAMFKSDEHTRDIRRIISELPQSPPLRYHSALNGDLEVAVCIDASFASNEDHSSQLGIICLIREKSTGKCNIIHFVSVKSKRVCRSVLVAELLAMIEGYDVGFAVRQAAKDLLGEDLPLALYTDSQSLYHLSVSLTRTRERRMQIDLQILREAYEKRDITSIFWISGTSNPADGLTKRAKNKALHDLVHTSRFMPEMQARIHRDEFPVRANMQQSIHKEEVGGVWCD